LPTYLITGQILITIALIAVVLFQSKGGGLGGIFGQPDSVYRTRRGVEKILFYLTIILAVIFVVFAILIVRATS
jgi:preprotein translocase subunit SecG